MNPQQQRYLDAMGIQLWERRLGAAAGEPGAVVAAVPVPAQVALETSAPSPVPPLATPAGARQQPEAMATKAPLPAPAPTAVKVDDGIPAWLDEAPPLEAPMFDMEEGEFDVADFLSAAMAPLTPDLSNLDWPALQQRVSGCNRCPALVASRRQPLFGAGNPQADWMIIGAVPDADEESEGEPFVGPQGALLNAMLQALGLKRQQVYLTNVLKCATPEHREPTAEETAACSAYLQRQIALVQPKIILVAGRIAAQSLLQVQTPIGKLRGTVHRYQGGIPVVVTYHPAYLLRSPLEKRQSWADLCLARSAIRAGA